MNLFILTYLTNTLPFTDNMKVNLINVIILYNNLPKYKIHLLHLHVYYHKCHYRTTLFFKLFPEKWLMASHYREMSQCTMHIKTYFDNDLSDLRMCRQACHSTGSGK